MLKTYAVYDFEVFPNVITCAMMDKFEKTKVFEISPRKPDVQNIQQFRDFILELSLKKIPMVGFNNVGYDYPILHYIMVTLAHVNGSKTLTEMTYAKSQEIIQSKDRFAHTFWDNQMIVPQIDLFKMHHLDRKTQYTSLKKLQFNMQLNNLMECELPFDKPVTNMSDIDDIIKYNINDVYATKKFLDVSEFDISFREKIAEHGEFLYNMNDTKLGENFFLKRLRPVIGNDKLYTFSNGKKVKRQTHRSVLPVKDLLFPYIKFETPELQDVLNQYKKQYVYTRKGKLSMNNHQDVIQRLDQLEEYKRRAAPILKICDKETKTEINNKIKSIRDKYEKSKIYSYVDNVPTVWGVGGLHGSYKKMLFQADDQYTIIDLDVSSYYPNVGIVNGLYPEHLGIEFCNVYKDLKEERKKYPKSTHLEENLLIKLGLNGIYGKTNDNYSFFKDILYTATTTVNGQLMLGMLCEMMTKLNNEVSDSDIVQIIQINTDGITIKLKRGYEDKCFSIAKQWEKITGLELESAKYINMWVKDNNNYIAEYEDGGVKLKGCYNHHELFRKDKKPKGIKWHNNHSAQIIKLAAERHLVKGESIRSILESHDNILDFCLSTNLKKSDNLYWGEEKIQNVSRYLITNDGKPLTKVMPPLKGKSNDRHSAIEKGYYVTICNDIHGKNIGDYDINYEYYIEKIEDITEIFS